MRTALLGVLASTSRLQPLAYVSSSKTPFPTTPKPENHGIGIRSGLVGPGSVENGGLLVSPEQFEDVCARDAYSATTYAVAANFAVPKPSPDRGFGDVANVCDLRNTVDRRLYDRWPFESAGFSLW